MNLFETRRVRFSESQTADIYRCHPQMAEVFLSRNDISRARLIIRSGQREIIMLAVPINYYQATALPKMSEGGSSQGVNDLGQFRFVALFRGNKHKYPVSSINMSAPKTNALRLF